MKKKKRKKKRLNYLARYLETVIRQHPFIRDMFKVYRVPLERLKHVHLKVCYGHEHIAEIPASKNGHYWIEIDYRMAPPSLFHVLVHEINHVLRMMSGSQISSKYFWNYDHDVEEHESILWEIRYLRWRGIPKGKALRWIVRGTVGEKWPKVFLELLWWLMEKEGWTEGLHGRR